MTPLQAAILTWAQHIVANPGHPGYSAPGRLRVVCEWCIEYLDFQGEGVGWTVIALELLLDQQGRLAL